MTLYEDVDIILFIRLSRLRWIGHVNRMDKEREVYNMTHGGEQIILNETCTRTWILYHLSG
jgi:hypothetical protein